MKQIVSHYYQKLSIIQKLSVPMIIASLFGFLLTLFIVNKVYLIQSNTTFLQKELIPAFEKSTNNLTLLKNISENLMFATLAAEEEMVLDIQDNRIIKENLKEIISHKRLNLVNVPNYLKAFENYFQIASQYTLNAIQSDSIQEDGETAKKLLNKYNEVKQHFSKLNNDIDKEISLRIALIEETSMQLIYFTITYIVVFSIVLFFTSYINYKDIHDYDIIEKQREELSRINNNVQRSIEYAALIQEAILPPKDILKSYSKNNFIFWKPKDVVGGDIYFVTELESKNEVLIMVIDGVGHGVSGAFLTILVKALEAQIVEQISKGVLTPSPAEILKYFNISIKTILKQNRDSKSNVGFDGGILYYNQLTHVCKYAGAKTPLYILNDNALEVIKSNRQSVGFIRTKIDQEYTDYDVDLKEGTKLYISTDGLIDQEGLENSRYGKARFKEMILNNQHKDFKSQKEAFKSSFMDLKGNLEQSDDITVIGLELK